MVAAFQLVAVAFLCSTGGRVRVLLAVDRNGEQLFGGEPALLVEHRPGANADELELETSDRIRASAVHVVLGAVAVDLARMVEDAHDEFGQLDGQRLLGRRVTLDAPFDTFQM